MENGYHPPSSPMLPLARLCPRQPPSVRPRGAHQTTTGRSARSRGQLGLSPTRRVLPCLFKLLRPCSIPLQEKPLLPPATRAFLHSTSPPLDAVHHFQVPSAATAPSILKYYFCHDTNYNGVRERTRRRQRQRPLHGGAAGGRPSELGQGGGGPHR
jgi:hypothetical protein